MELFNKLEVENWIKRRHWINNELEQAEIGLVYACSDHATALFMDMQIAFCASAYISVVVMSISVIDAHLRETDAMDTSIGTASLLNTCFEGNDINWLRQLRNKYVHHNVDRPILEINHWFNHQSQLEEDATKAMKITISTLFQNPGI